MKKKSFLFEIVASLLLIASLSGTANAVVQIVSSSPKKFIQGNYSYNQLPLHIYYDKWLPDDINGSNINARVKVYARSEGNFQELFTDGWTPDSMSCWLPTSLLKNQGFLQVKVTVDGVDSNVFSISIVAAPSKPPVITSVSPDHFDVTNGAVSADLNINVSNIDGWGFTGVLIDGKSAFIGNLIIQPGEETYGTIMTSMPKELLTKSAQHTVQVKTRAGLSNIVNVMVGTLANIKSVNPGFKLADPITITKLTPSFLTKAQTSAGAPEVSITAIFSGATPKSILYRIDKTGAWYQIQQPIIFGNQATFSLPFGILQPKSLVEIKMVNDTGEAIKDLNVVPDAQDKPESMLQQSNTLKPVLPGTQEKTKNPVRVNPLPPK
jgi:hypothetical protein